MFRTGGTAPGTKESYQNGEGGPVSSQRQLESSQHGNEEEAPMKERYLTMDRSKSVESVRLLRLRGLLRDVVRRKGSMSRRAA